MENKIKKPNRHESYIGKIIPSKMNMDMCFAYFEVKLNSINYSLFLCTFVDGKHLQKYYPKQFVGPDEAKCVGEE